MAHFQGSRRLRSPEGPPPSTKNEECAHGNVAFLPVQARGEHTIRCVRGHNCDKKEVMDWETGYGHPVIILRIVQREGSTIPGDVVCLCAEATTFQEVSLTSWKNNQHLLKFRVSIPLFMGSAVQPPGVTPSQQLHTIRHAGRLDKQTFVRVQHIWEIPIDLMWNYVWRNSCGWGIRLTKESYELLLNCFNWYSDDDYYESVPSIPQFAKWRNDTLCGTLLGLSPRPTAVTVGALSSQAIEASGIDFSKFVYEVKTPAPNEAKSHGIAPAAEGFGSAGRGRVGTGGRGGIGSQSTRPSGPAGTQGPPPALSLPPLSAFPPVRPPPGWGRGCGRGNALVASVVPFGINSAAGSAGGNRQQTNRPVVTAMGAQHGQMGFSAKAADFVPARMTAPPPTSTSWTSIDKKVEDENRKKPRLNGAVADFVPSWEVKKSKNYSATDPRW